MRLIAKKQPKGTHKRGQPRKRVVPWWRRKPALFGFATLLVAAAAGYGWWAWNAGVPQRLAEQTRAVLMQRSVDLGFGVREIFVEGRKNTPIKALRKALALERGAPILFVDIVEARERLLALPWVSEVSVERVLPDTVVVHLVERSPLALWQNNGRFALIDKTGTVIERDHLGRFADLMVVVGDDEAARKAADLLAALATEPELMKRVEAAVLVSGRRWDLHLSAGIAVKMPEEDFARGWRRLAEYQRRHDLLDTGVRTIDLRLPHRVVVGPIPSANIETKAPKKNA